MSIRLKKTFIWISLIASSLMAVKISKDIYKLWHVDDRIVEANEELAKLNEEKRELEFKLENISDPIEEERRIRNTLKMSKANEVVVVIPEEIVNIADEPKDVVESDKTEMSNWDKWLKVFNLI